MAQVIVRNLEDSVKRKLKQRAAGHGHSMEQEIREILRNAVKHEGHPRRGLGTEIANSSRGSDLRKTSRSYAGFQSGLLCSMDEGELTWLK
jgi:plasmid stability protein